MPSKPSKDILDTFDIDADDVKILKIFQETPEITHSEIAKNLNKSQPAVGARVLKLQRKDLLATQKGINFKTNKELLYLVIVNLQTKDPSTILESELPRCPFMINVLKTSGQRNLIVLLAAANMEKLESIIDRHFRSNPDIISVETSFVVDVLKDLIFPVNWEFLKYDDIPCGDICCQKVKKRIENLPEQLNVQAEDDT
jgi:Lrp/AsnC family transcriptional regulator, leucine-responsive regulatory protein